jgi:hypothetical protein
MTPWRAPQDDMLVLLLLKVQPNRPLILRHAERNSEVAIAFHDVRVRVPVRVVLPCRDDPGSRSIYFSKDGKGKRRGGSLVFIHYV